MIRSSVFGFCALITLGLAPGGIRADAGDPTLRTDHPHYPGEGAFQTVADCVAFATAGQSSNQDKAIALYLWLLKHQWHLFSPRDCPAPWRINDIRDSNENAMVWDADRARFSFGYGLCGTVHAWNEPYWQALGMPARRRAFPGHTNSEVFYDGSWHAFDTDMAGLIFRKDGVVAGYEDVMADPSCATRYRPPLPHYPFAWPSDERTMRQGWAEVARGGSWFKMYHTGFAAHPGIVHLRSGESFTRTWDPDALGGPSKRRFWHMGKGGPVRDWAFVDEQTPWHEGPKSNARGNAAFGNAVFDYRPDLNGDKWRQGLALPPRGLSPAAEPRGLKATQEGASLVFCHFSPYVICGDPADDTNPMTAPATQGFIVEGKTAGPWTLEISTDQGQTWRARETVDGSFRLDRTDLVKGHYGWWARWTGANGSVLESIRFVTSTQINQAMYPRLKRSGSQVTLRRADRAVVPLLPNLGGPEADFAPWEIRTLRSPHLIYEPGSGKTPGSFQTRPHRPATVAFRLDSPTDLLEVTAAARFKVRVPPAPGSEYRLEHSLDQGATWLPLGQVRIAPDNELSHGSVSGRAKIDRAGVKSVWIRVHLDGGGYPTGLTQFQAYGVRRTEPTSPLSITHEWIENGKTRTHRETLSPKTAELRYLVPTGAALVEKSVRLEAP